MTTLQVLIHAPTIAALHRAQSNVRNLLQLSSNAEIELVVNGPAMPEAITISNPEIKSRLRLCQNSLRTQGLTAPADMQQISAAILHLSERQQQGWSYVRA
ncbi:hypothetical protein [Oceanisphaera sp. IT1-181]|uniref:DsrE family protein n=1 Tax=Oceanisphaera sp. IT1-181 TaxID=3081199 RepID=UPI0029C9D2B2|nr:hypothetical protein [Oceanisphaera sp. IT1-181]